MVELDILLKEKVRKKRAKFLRKVKKVCGKEGCTRVECKDCRDIFGITCRLSVGFTWR
jgi:hypothetical protein